MKKKKAPPDLNCCTGTAKGVLWREVLLPEENMRSAVKRTLSWESPRGPHVREGGEPKDAPSMRLKPRHQYIAGPHSQEGGRTKVLHRLRK